MIDTLVAVRYRGICTLATCAILVTTMLGLSCLTAKEHYAKGEEYLSNQQYPEAIEQYTKAISQDSNYTEAYVARGSAYNAKNEYDKAIADFNVAILDSPKASYYTGRGLAYSLKGEYNLALDDYNMAIELDPKGAWNYYARGYFYYKSGRYDSAIVDFLGALHAELTKYGELTDQGKSPTDAYNEISAPISIFYRNLGKAYYDKADYNNAIDACTMSIKFESTNGESYNTRGEAYQKLGESIKAEDDFQKAKEMVWTPPE